MNRPARPVFSSCWGIGVLAVMLASAPVWSQEPPATSQPMRITTAVSRADLGLAYMRLDRALIEHPSKPEELDQINRGFDQATLKFFAGEMADAVQSVNQLTWQVLGSPPPRMGQALAYSLQVRMTPAVLAIDSNVERLARVKSMYEIRAEESPPIEFVLRISDGARQVLFEQPFLIGTEPLLPVDTTVAVRNLLHEPAPGMCTIDLVLPDGTAVFAAHWRIVPTSLDAARQSNVTILNALLIDKPDLAEAIAICSSRNKLLTDSPSAANSAQILIDPNTLLNEIGSEIKAMEAGGNPYLNRPGDLWRMLQSGQTQVPLRLYVPQFKPGQKLPLLIALHGAGGDENMFLEAYGNGLIKRLADEKGFIVAAPLTYSFNNDAFDALLNNLSKMYPIDASRIYVVGHSLGAGAAAGLAAARSDRIAAAACIAGGSFSATKLPPTLVIGAELDPLFRANRFKPAVEKAIAAGLPIELRMIEHQGHTLIVGAVLPDVIAWLMQHQQGDQSR